MKHVVSLSSLMIVVLFAVITMAANKVVVIPLFKDAPLLEPVAPVTADSPVDSHYVINAETVIDKVTGLEWQRLTEDVVRAWDQAVDYCFSLELDDHDDWRLPEAKELSSIVDYGAYLPAINTTAFPLPSSYSTWNFWAKSTTALSNWARAVYFSSGKTTDRPKSVENIVRCVRKSAAAQGWALQDNDNGTLTDLTTGLTWQKSDDNTTRTWFEAASYCNGLEHGSKSDWRLPRVKELLSIVDYRSMNPAIDNTRFPGTISADYWSASSHAFNGDLAWTVHFNGGSILEREKINSYNVRCVR